MDKLTRHWNIEFPLTVSSLDSLERVKKKAQAVTFSLE
jgi:hypothetical protein